MTETTEKTPFHWKSNIAWKNRDRIVVRGYDVNELTGNLDFGQMLFLVLKGELPTEAQAMITNAMMVSLAEHAMSPSSATVRFATSGGAELNGAVSAGVAAIGRLHGTADRPANMYIGVEQRAAAEGIPMEQAAALTVQEMRARRENMPGYHHAQHIRDPRTVRLLELSDKWGISGTYVAIARAMEDATEAVFGRRLWINGPGAMGCIGLDAGYSPLEMKAMFITARTLSLCAHSIEESTREKGWRASENSDMVQPLSLQMQGPDWYDGPADRELPTGFAE
ncbi:citryl-CoA lyase [Catenulispora sp. NF23]|uniref:citrate synthase (unknown stereospecificity) n=1 Tax=Catenulispora pinistramenti TaxID=2705254 RepID=A0ABS5L0M8_9ACTN|nr:citrate/2-methylcitrate synthase [Catenulispora pinistramenti]MBS2535310.1 citryl-CoA lyase [Catenulispora pinistramenti]MBS2551851.1 citryl-CoA lyase [Catenulispora pinistramenti]